ncbi:MAG TPA: methyltransferase domain-containing protein, partial [Candidatus Paceibacterota bacterium]|nr:methyltransferase domain-containing protein [Candidatus Paceibacterota bacterium]
MSLEEHSSPQNNKPKIPHTWVVDTTQAMRKPGGRDLSNYKEFLDFDEKDLEGKTVLDLGSGSQEKLTRNLQEAGIEAKVVSLNPDYSIPKYRRIINSQEDWQRKSVASVAQDLPFRDNTFDFILGLESVTMYEDAFEKPLSAEAWSREI